MQPEPTIEAPATPSGLQRTLDALERVLDTLGLARRLRLEVLLVAEELAANTVHHGTRLAPRGSVVKLWIAIEASGGQRVTVHYADDAPAHDPFAAPPDARLGEHADRRPGGAGLALVRALARRVEYTRIDGRNCIRVDLEARAEGRSVDRGGA